MSEPALAVRDAGPGDQTAWEAYLASNPEATAYHTFAWKDFIVDVFGHRPAYLIAESKDGVRGVLPMFRAAFPGLGSKLISMPYDVASGGPLADSPETTRALAEAAIERAEREGVGYLELRCGAPNETLESLGFQRSEPVLVSDVLDLPDEETIWKSLPPDRRKSVRRSERRGVTVREAETREDLDGIYDAYLRVFRDFGTPPYGRKYLDGLWERLRQPGLVRILTAEAGGRCVGGAFLFVYGKVLIAKITVVLPEAMPLHATGAFYWKTIQTAIEAGCSRLSFGSSARSRQGLLEYKEGWGATTAPAIFYSMPIRGKVPSIEKYYDSDGLAQRAWRKLPLGITPLIGHPLNRWFC